MRGERDFLAGLRDLHSSKVYFHIPKICRTTGARALRAAYRGLDARQKLSRAERFGDIIVGSEFKKQDFIGDFGNSAENHHGDVWRPVSWTCRVPALTCWEALDQGQLHQ